MATARFFNSSRGWVMRWVKRIVPIIARTSQMMPQTMMNRWTM